MRKARAIPASQVVSVIIAPSVATTVQIVLYVHVHPPRHSIFICELDSEKRCHYLAKLPIKSSCAMFVHLRMAKWGSCVHSESAPGFILLSDSESTVFLIVGVGKAAMAKFHVAPATYFRPRYFAS